MRQYGFTRAGWIAWFVLLILALQGVAWAAIQSIERVSVGAGGVEGNGDTGNANDAPIAMTPDGRFVAFLSFATNLVPGDTNSRADVFVRDRRSGTTERVSVSSAGAQGNAESGPADGDFRRDTLDISNDGRYVAFTSYASNLVSTDTNGVSDVFVHDRQTHATERVSISDTEQELGVPSYQPSISNDGRLVAYSSPSGGGAQRVRS
jgi:Tol biopolymer transport system component